MKLKDVARLKSGGKTNRFPEAGVLAVMIIIYAFFAFTSDKFLGLSNQLNIARQVTEVTIAAIGMTFVIITGEIDLSPGAVYGMSAAIAATILKAGGAPIVAFGAAMGASILIGVISGLFVTEVRVPAFIITLCIQMMLRGLIYVVTGGSSISRFPDTDNWFFKMGARIGSINFPVQIFMMLILVAIFAIILKRTRFGFKIYTIGGNIHAAEVCGINTKRTKVTAFALSSALAGFAGLISLTYLGSLYPTAGSGKEMDIVAACILGGTNLAGGSGTILGTFIGAITIGIIRNGLVLLGVDSYILEVMVGAVILAGVCVDTVLKRRRASRTS